MVGIKKMNQCSFMKSVDFMGKNELEFKILSADIFSDPTGPLENETALTK